MHKNPLCAAVLANHIYLQMRDMDVMSPGNSYDRTQHLSPNPRRAGLPRTVTEWKAQADARRQAKLQCKNGQTSDDFQNDELSAFEIAQSMVESQTSSQTRSSARLLQKNSSKRLQPAKLGSSNFLTQLATRSTELKIARNTQTPVLTLSPDSSQGCEGNKPVQPSTLSPEVIAPIDLGTATPQGQKRGAAPEGFLYALQEPAVFNGRIVNIKNVIQIMDTKCMKRKKHPANPRAAIICSIHLNMWPVAELCTRDMAVGLLEGSTLGDIYVVSLYCDGESKKAVPDEFRRLNRLAKKENKQILMLMDSNSHSETYWSSKKTCSRGREWDSFLNNNQHLVVANIGDHFTFMSKRGQTIIDVTIATPQVTERISQWGVVDCIPNSDHLAIEMLLQLDGVWTPPPLKCGILANNVSNWSSLLLKWKKKALDLKNANFGIRIILMMKGSPSSLT